MKNANPQKLIPSDGTAAHIYSVTFNNLWTNKTFNQMIYFESFSNGWVRADYGVGTDYQQDESFSFTNNYPFTLDIMINYTEKEVYVSHTDYTEEWEATGGVSHIGTQYTPEYVQNQLGQRPDNPSVGDTWTEVVLDYFDEINGVYYLDLVEYEYVRNSDTYNTTYYGAVAASIDGADIGIYNGVTISLQPNKTLDIIFYGVVEGPDDTYISDDPGGVDFYWYPSLYFKPGANFLNNGVPQFALSDLSDGIVTQTVKFSVTLEGMSSYGVLNLDINNSTTFQHSTGYGQIYPLYRFAWDTGHAPSATGLWTNFTTTPTTSATDQDGYAVSFGSGMRASYSPTSLTVNNVPLSGFYQAFNFSFAVIAKGVGIESADFLPAKHKQYYCGNQDYWWKEGWFQTLYLNGAQLTSAKKSKKDIEDFDKPALKLIDQTKVVSYRYKEEEGEQKHIGFVADDTPEELSTKKHNVMDIGNCIGLLIKAVQELSDKIKKLEDK